MEREIERATGHKKSNTRVEQGLARLKVMRIAGMKVAYRSDDWESRMRPQCVANIRKANADGTITTAEAREAQELLDKHG